MLRRIRRYLLHRRKMMCEFKSLVILPFTCCGVSCQTVLEVLMIFFSMLTSVLFVVVGKPKRTNKRVSISCCKSTYLTRMHALQNISWRFVFSCVFIIITKEAVNYQENTSIITLIAGHHNNFGMYSF